MFFLLPNLTTTIVVLCLDIKASTYVPSKGRNVLLINAHKTVIWLVMYGCWVLICWGMNTFQIFLDLQVRFPARQLLCYVWKSHCIGDFRFNHKTDTCCQYQVSATWEVSLLELIQFPKKYPLTVRLDCLPVGYSVSCLSFVWWMKRKTKSINSPCCTPNSGVFCILVRFCSPFLFKSLELA